MNNFHDDHLEGHKAKQIEEARLHHIEKSRIKSKQVLEDSIKRLSKLLNLSQKNNNSL